MRTKTNLQGFNEMIKSDNYKGVLPDLKCIQLKQRPKKDCPLWYMDGIEQADLAYQTNQGWKLTSKGIDIIHINEALITLFDLIDDEKFDEAREAMEKLRGKLGENDPELTRASSLLKFLEGTE